MIVNAKYKKFVLLLRDWNIEHGLGLTQPRNIPAETSGPNEYDRVQMWQVGNCSLFVMTEGLDRTNIVLWPPESGDPVDSTAIRAWDKLEKLANELNALFEPMTVNWRISELEAWVNTNKRERNIQVMFFQPASGPIQINHEVEGGGIISLLAERLSLGQIEITPTYSATAGGFPMVVNEIKLWRRELEKTLAATDGTVVPNPNDPVLPLEEREYRNKLLNLTLRYFSNKDDLAGLYFELGIPYDSLTEGGTRAKAQALIEHCGTRERLSELREAIRQARPNIEVPNPPSK